MPVTIDLNADVGESDGDLDLVGIVTSASIACGGHAGDEASMLRAIKTARDRGVAIGAHPSYPDQAGFGRREVGLPMADIADAVWQQVATLARLTRELECKLAYVKPHGALYHRLTSDGELAELVLAALREFGRIGVLAGPGSAFLASAHARGLPLVAEGFCDRLYTADGNLVGRDRPDAVIGDPDVAVRQSVALATRQEVRACDGSTVRVPATSLCVHGDTPGASDLARRVRTALEEAGMELRAAF